MEPTAFPSRLTAVNPESLAKPRGYNHGMKGQGELLFVAGQIGWSREERLVSDDFVAQFAQALDNVLDVVWAGGGSPTSIARITVYVTDKAEYLRDARRLGEAWRKRMGKHYPAMSLVEVKALLTEGAKVEIEATALL
jgi:enamine deaminase RidA (YjgF/YER057c/UK114 family)